jgi:hypothetical protein
MTGILRPRITAGRIYGRRGEYTASTGFFVHRDGKAIGTASLDKPAAKSESTMMYARAVLTAFLLSLPVFCSCSSEQQPIAKKTTQQGLASLEIRRGATFQFPHETVEVLKLIPKGSPSGEISLKSAHNGQIECFQTFRFQGMSEDGDLAVRVTDTDIDLAFNAKCHTSVFSRTNVLLPAKDKYRGGSSFDYVGQQGDHESLFWTRVYLLGKQPSQWSEQFPRFTDFLTKTKEYPTLKAYVLTVSLDRTSQQVRN